VSDDEFRVEIRIDEEADRVSFEERLRAAELDSEARERLGGRAIVTHEDDHVFIYAADERGAREAERVARELVAPDGPTARIRMTRWHPIEENWEDASVPLPATDEDRAAERRIREAAEQYEVSREGTLDWQVHARLPGRHEAGRLAATLSREGVPVERRFSHVLAGALTELRAEELAQRIRAEAPSGSEVRVEARDTGAPHPLFVFARALGRR
jgi:hypothetical protein